MCASVEAAAMDRAGPCTGNVEDDMLTAWFEAAQLFSDESRLREFAPSAMARAMPGLREQRKALLDCDVVFTGVDGDEVWAHRFVMCHKFSGCYKLFDVARESMTPEQKRGVWTRPIQAVIRDLEGDMIELLVDFAYQIPLCERVGTHNVARVLELAVKLKILTIRDHCLRTLKQNLEPESCIDTYHMAVNHGYDSLASEALRYLFRNFDQVWKNSPQFEALTPEEIRALLEDSRLHAPSEVEDTFRSILKWISADVGARRMYLAQFLPLVRFARFTVLDFEKVIISPEVQCNADSLKVLNVIHQTLTRPSMAVGEVAGIDLSPKLWLTPRLPKDILFLFGGWTSCASNHMQTYNCRAEKWRFLCCQCTPPRAYHGAVVVNSCIYVLGGFNGRECYHSVVCFDVSLNRWINKANMAYARCYVSVAILQGYIYAMGGFTGEARTMTAERYDVKNNRWSMIANMIDGRSDASAGAACGRIYIVGGFTGHSVLDSVDSYDPSTDSWTRVVTMSTPRSGAQVVIHKDTLYIIGGYNGRARLSSMEQLDARRGRFSELPSMPSARSNFAAAVLEGCIYVIGGFNGTATIQIVEKYNIAERKWYTAPPIGNKCSAAVACVVPDLANPASWI